MNDIESIVSAVKGISNKPDSTSAYPCTHCHNNDHCTLYMKCYSWTNWFTTEWRKIRKYFGKG